MCLYFATFRGIQLEDVKLKEYKHLFTYGKNTGNQTVIQGHSNQTSLPVCLHFAMKNILFEWQMVIFVMFGIEIKKILLALVLWQGSSVGSLRLIILAISNYNCLWQMGKSDKAMLLVKTDWFEWKTPFCLWRKSWLQFFYCSPNTCYYRELRTSVV